MTDRELLQQALKALEYHTAQTRPIQGTEYSILAIRTALAEQESLEPDIAKIVHDNLWNLYVEDTAEPEQEPMVKYSDIVSDGGFDPRNRYDTAPPQRKPLTDERCVSIFREAFLANSDPLVKDNMTVAFARAIERAHGIGVER